MTRRDINTQTIIMLAIVAGIALILLSGIIDWSTVDTETILAALVGKEALWAR
jgi:type II secretory pathway pseudopilin PulG